MNTLENSNIHLTPRNNVKIFRDTPHLYYDSEQKRYIAYLGWIVGYGDSFKEAWYQLQLKKGLIQL